MRSEKMIKKNKNYFRSFETRNDGINYLLETSPLFFLIVGRLSSDGDCSLLLLLCVSSMAAEFGVGNADGTDVGVAMICWIVGLDSLLMVCD